MDEFFGIIAKCGFIAFPIAIILIGCYNWLLGGDFFGWFFDPEGTKAFKFWWLGSWVGVFISYANYVNENNQ